MRRWWLVIVLLVSLGVNVGLAGVAVYRRVVARGALDLWERSADPGAFLADRLHIQGSERERFLVLQRELVTKLKATHQEIARVRGELEKEVLSDTPDRKRIDASLAELATRQAELDRILVDHALATREALSGEERVRYEKFLDRWIDRLNQRSSPRPGRFGGALRHHAAEPPPPSPPSP